MESDDTEYCDECGNEVELIEKDAKNPLTGDIYDRHKCPCGEKTVLDFEQSMRPATEQTEAQTDGR